MDHLFECQRKKERICKLRYIVRYNDNNNHNHNNHNNHNDDNNNNDP